jgi:hypothetical protein
MFEKTEGAIKNGQSRDTVNMGHTRHRMNTSNGYFVTINQIVMTTIDFFVAMTST